MAIVTMKELLEAGVHFGHPTGHWHPKMRPYLFIERKGIHIIDLQQTIDALEEICELVRDTVSRGGVILLVGTKKQAQETIALEAQRCGMPYVNQRWLGGTLTNFRTIRQRIEHLLDLERRRAQGEFAILTKKEMSSIDRLIERLNRRFGGIKELTALPDLIFITDVGREAIAVKEANAVRIPIIAVVDTDCDPDPVDYVIPGNDDAIRAIKLITSKLADAALEGKQMREVAFVEEVTEAVLEELEGPFIFEPDEDEEGV